MRRWALQDEVRVFSCTKRFVELIVLLFLKFFDFFKRFWRLSARDRECAPRSAGEPRSPKTTLNHTEPHRRRVHQMMMHAGSSARTRGIRSMTRSVCPSFGCLGSSCLKRQSNGSAPFNASASWQLCSQTPKKRPKATPETTSARGVSQLCTVQLCCLLCLLSFSKG